MNNKNIFLIITMILAVIPLVFAVPVTVELNSPNDAILSDNVIDASVGDTNRETNDYININSNNVWIEFMWARNQSLIPCGSTILEAYAIMHIHEYGAGGTQSISIYNANGSTLNVGSETWNNQPCGTSFDNAVRCNLTAEDTKSVTTTLDIDYKWNITPSVKRAVKECWNNFTYVMKSTGSTENIFFNPKENAVANSLKDRLNVTYEAQAADTTPPALLNNDAYFINGEYTWQYPTKILSNTTLLRINFTTDEAATCAVMGNSTIDANKNYTDMIAGGGVQCETTGTANHICTMQASNAFSVGKNKYVYAGCKDTAAALNELRNATFSWKTNVYTYSASSTTLGCMVVGSGCSVTASGGCNYILK